LRGGADKPDAGADVSLEDAVLALSSTGTEADTGEEEDAAGEPGRVVAISAGTEAEIVEILEKRES